MQDLRSRVINRISKDDWTSDKRRRYLERLGTLTASSKIRVRFENVPTAACAWKESRGHHAIKMRREKLPNPSKYKVIFKKVGDSQTHTLFQEGLLYHELGHVLMSDYDEWESVVNEVGSGSLKKKKMAKQFLNCTEDVVIEAWLRRKFDCGKILDFKNEAKFHLI